MSGTHPDAVASTKIVSELPLDPDIKAIINSVYVDPKNLMYAQIVRNTKPNGKTSDGYHTFDELYEHRITLFITLCRVIKTWEHGDQIESPTVWRSEIHSDGSDIEGWFILGIGHGKGEQITYHLPVSAWSQTDFADTLKRAPEFDGHTSNDVLARLKSL